MGSEIADLLQNYRDLSELKIRVEGIVLERDSLRAQLAEAKKHAEYQDKEIRQWANVCYVGTWPLSEDDTKNTGFYGRMAAKMTAERNAATARAEKAEAERDALAARVAELEGVMSAYFNGYMLDEAEDEDICVDGERQHLRARAVGDALARTPAQSLAKVQAAALREICKDREHGGLCQRVAVDYLDWTGKQPLASQLHARPMFRLSVLDADEVMKTAERLESEAENG